MRAHAIVALSVAVVAGSPWLALAQRFPFERSFDAPQVSAIDLSTRRGKIEIIAADPDRVVVQGVVTVRIGWDVPLNAVELARKVAAAPPLERVGDTLQLRAPADDESQRAVTVSYRILVPARTRVRVASDSGAVSLSGLAGSADVRTQSGAIGLRALGGAVSIDTGSGAVEADGISGPFKVTTQSSAILARSVGSSLQVRTQSGAVDAAMSGDGDIDVETGSSAIRLAGLQGGLKARTQSGRMSVRGSPNRPWTAETGSSAVDLDVDAPTPFSLDAASRSGSSTIEGTTLEGVADKRALRGTVRGGGALVRIITGSGAIHVRVSP